MIGGETVPFRVVRSAERHKTIALQMRTDGQVVVRAPAHTPITRIKEVLRRKTAWLSVRRRMALAKAVPTASTKEFVAGESFSLLGQQRRLKFVSREGAVTAEVSGRSLVVAGPAQRALTPKEIRSALRACFQREATFVFRQRLLRFWPKLGLKTPPRLHLADQTRRWGSCSSRSELRLNWQLVGAPLSLVDYVIVHELCHLRWSNHSTRFWRELRRILPDYTQRERALAAVGPDLIF